MRQPAPLAAGGGLRLRLTGAIMSIEHWASTTPHSAALIIAETGETVSFRELVERSNRAAHLLRDLGLRAGDHVAFMVDNSPLFFDLCWAALRSGLVYTPMSIHLAAEDAGYILSDCDARVFIASHSLKATAIDAAKHAPLLEHRFLSDGAEAGFYSWQEAVAECPVSGIADPSLGIDMSYSSGTTGRPKGVVRPPERIPFGHPDAVMERGHPGHGFSKNTRFLVPNPVYHSAPSRFSMIVQSLGGTVVLMQKFDPENALAAIERYRANHGLFVPTMFVRMLQLDPETRQRYDVSSLRQVVHAAAPCPTPVKEQMLDWWGPIVDEFYGSTEQCGFTHITAAEWVERKNSIGRPTLGKFHVLDDQGRALPAGEIGTIWVEGAEPFSYYKAPDKTAESCNERGWQTLGDVGYIDEQGYVYLTGRNAFTINSGGVKISPKEVEDVLATHPSVVEAAVFGIPCPHFGEQVKAVVQLHDHSEAGAKIEAELIELCRARLSRIKAPKSIDFEEILPRDAVGKLLKKTLKARYWPAPGEAGRT